MNRAIRWLQLGGRQREYALGIALGCSGAAVFSAYNYHRPHLLDGGQYSDAWNNAPNITSQNATSPGRREGFAKHEPELPRTQESVQRKAKISQTPPPPTQGHSVFGAEGDLPGNDPLQAWQQATDRVAAVCGTFKGFDLTTLKEKIAGILIPSWIRSLPGWLNKLQSELSMEPWSLSWEIWEEAHDPEINPEIIWDAEVRVSDDLCKEENAFLSRRRQYTAKALAKYLGVPESEVHPEDVPVIGICGSGGGLRALVAGTASYLSTAEDGLFDCVTYSAGVSGSCWLQTLYYSLIGRQSHAHIIDHLKHRIGVNIAYPPALFSLLSQAPTNKYEFLRGDRKC
jgi:cytosolic phospholipase A2